MKIKILFLKVVPYSVVILALFVLSVSLVNNPDQEISLAKVLNDDLASGFTNPPDSAKPWVFMWWYGKITPEDITQHMEELKSKGVGGVLLFDHGGMPGVPYAGDAWRELFRHTVREADRLGLKMGANICAGWPSGGPWVTPENSSWMVVSSDTLITGLQNYTGRLPEPTGKGFLYKDIAIQAFPFAAGKPDPFPVVTVSSNPQELRNLLDGNYNTVWNAGDNDGQWIQEDFGTALTVDWAWIDIMGKVDIQASDDGIAFRHITTLEGPWPQWNPVYEAVPATTARWFRIGVPAKARIRDFALGTRVEVERFASLAAKRALTNPLGMMTTRQSDQTRFIREDLKSLPGEPVLQVNERIDLTTSLSDSGMLNWKVPPGTWKVVRIGRSTTGLNNGGGGLLTDYLSPAASEQNFENAMKPLISDAGSLAGKTFQYFHEDNVEIGGVYSWTPGLLEEFQKRRGYDPSPYLAALAGEIVGNTGITDRFLADIRRTIADCVAEGHYQRWAELVHAHGVKVRAEAGGQNLPILFCNDGLMNLGKMDVPVAEFWENEYWKENQWAPANNHAITTPGWDEAAQNINAKQVASAGHLYGKNIVAAESFTSLGRRAHWGVAPADLLLYANIAFCEGINAMTIHGSATSGPEEGKPGKVFAAGTHFNHNITWWNQSDAFLKYLSRCQYMLQQGRFVADVLYYNGDEVPNVVPPKNIDPSLGFGYDYDVCNTEILLARLSVKGGRIVLPDGMSYRVLVLPDRPVIPVKVALKIKELVAAGATVMGPKPLRTPGLSGYPESEQQLKDIADAAWGNGGVINGLSIREVLAKAHVSPDFSYRRKTENDLLDYIHRHTADADIYFVANRRSTQLAALCTFRVGEMQPELWNPVTGEQQLLPQFESNNGLTTIPLEFEPYGSMFVVFRKDHPLAKSGSRKNTATNFSGFYSVLEIAGPWQVQFDAQWFYPVDRLSGEQASGLFVFDKLADWTSRPEPAIQYFSGTALYRKTFNITQSMAGRRLFLDLGIVKETARVRLNGKDLGVLWCHPWRVEITGTIRQGENKLEVEVVNLWPNRLLGDKRLQPEQRRTHTNVELNPAQPLMTSGLLGPVRIVTRDKGRGTRDK
jgi:hypothetical protein